MSQPPDGALPGASPEQPRPADPEPATLAADNARLREQARSRAEFMQNLAHELATPLTPLVGYLKLLRSGRLGELTERQQQVLQAMVHATERLERSLDNLVDYAAMDSGQYRIHRTTFDAVALVDACVAELQPKARAKHVRIDVHKPPRLELAGDDPKIRLAFARVLDNAVKYSPHGGHVLVVLAEVPDRASFDVFDQGPGISPDTQKAIAQVRRDERTDGVGLSLPLARQVVEAHGGQLTLESPPKEQPEVRDVFSGSRVGFWIPRHP